MLFCVFLPGLMTLASSRQAQADELPNTQPAPITGLKWHPFPDKTRFGVLGLAWFNENSPKLYRMPENKFDELTKGVVNRSKTPSGGRILMRCSSSTLALKVLPINKGNNRGFDVYINGKYHSTAVAETPETESTLVLFSGLDTKEKEILVYLPHLQEVLVKAVGVDPSARFSPPEHKFAHPLPVVLYGSSVCQGSGGNHPGMTYGAILCRELNLDFINLGFGGAGKAEKNVVDLVKSIPACCYVFDLGKSYGSQDKTAYFEMLKTVRAAHPDVPILCLTPITSVKEVKEEEYSKRSIHTRTVMRDAVKDAEQAGAKNIRLIEGEDLLGFKEHDVLSKDGVHPSDKGYALIAGKLIHIVRKTLDIK